MQKKKTLEREVAETILQKKKTITIGGRKYKVVQPTAATLIMISAEVSELPEGMRIESGEDYFFATLRNAKDCKALGRILATMMIGARPTWIGQLLCRLRIRVRGRKLLARHSPRQLNAANTEMIRDMQVADFFALTAFLSGLNMTKATKAETTASGQQ